MAFSEKVKKEVKEKSDFKCVLCRSDIVEIHHIIPQEEGGPDTFENAVALCPSCHFIYGGNPLKKDEIISKRNIVYKAQEEKQKELLNLCRIKKAEGRYKVPIDPNNIVIFCKIKENEDFNIAAKRIYDLIYRMQEENPNKERTLHLEIEGHRNKEGGYDNDMFELQFHFLFKTMFQYLHALHMPLISVTNNKKQKQLPAESFIIADSEEEMKQLKKKYEKENKKIIEFKELD